MGQVRSTLTWSRQSPTAAQLNAQKKATDGPAVVALSEIRWRATHFARTADRVRISIMIYRASSARL